MLSDMLHMSSKLTHEASLDIQNQQNKNPPMAASKTMKKPSPSPSMLGHPRSIRSRLLPAPPGSRGSGGAGRSLQGAEAGGARPDVAARTAQRLVWGVVQRVAVGRV